MRFASVLRYRRGLLMQPHPSHSSPHASPSGSSLKRPYAQQAQPNTRPSTSSMSQRAGGGLSPAPSDTAHERPAKASKVDSATAQSNHFSTAAAYAHQPARGKQSSRFQASPSRGPSKAFGLQKSRRNKLPLADGPLHDESFIKATYAQGTLKREWETNPKSPLANLCMLVHGNPPKYEVKQALGPHGAISR